MKGMVIGGLGIFHVFLAQFAIGGGLLLCYFQWLGQTGREPHARRFLDGYFKILVLISFVIGALTGVGMWFTTIQVSARTIGVMVDEFHWIWAIEWTFFCLEVAAGYTFLRWGDRLPDRIRLRLLIAYAFAAWMSLFWINGILAWQLTPGGWLDGGGVWAGFFNPSFWPSLLYRTVVAMALAALAAAIVINTMGDLAREDKRRLIVRAAHFLAPMALMAPLGLWYLAVIPADSRSWLLGGSIAMTMFVGIAAGASLLIGGYAAVGLLMQRLYINGATATLLLALAFGATGAGEFVREGARKPFTVRGYLYSNSLTPDEVATLRRTGSVVDDPYPLRDAARYPTAQLQTGAKVYRLQCSVCHTMHGANALTDLAGTWTDAQLRMNIAELQHTKPFMPPFAGDAAEVEAIAQLIRWETAGAPRRWPDTTGDAATLRQIAAW
ncbi:MAG: cytochrome ubiquinol oxidase subunit I, partial [Myxococcales bacterium]|nr:cytochrome ubiquinol oxidase subunit I [Myxococcales bacterium]